MTLAPEPMVDHEPGSRQDPVPAPLLGERSSRYGNSRGGAHRPGADLSSPELLDLPTGRVVSFRFMRLALRRRRKVWLGLAVLGLLVGGALGLRGAMSQSYDATATVYLAQPPDTDYAVAAQDDLAMLQTAAVGTRAIALLGIHQLTSATLLGGAPGSLASDDVLVVTISGPTPRQAVARVNAVTKAYLSFRAQQYAQQIRSVIAGATGQIAKLTAQERAVTARIDALGSTAGGTSNQLGALVTQRGALETQIVTLEEGVHQDLLDTLTVAKGSKVITPGTPIPASSTKNVLMDVGTGLGTGLALGVALVLIGAVLSDRLRRRADVVEVLRAPVSLSIPRPRTHVLGRHCTSPDRHAATRRLVGHLEALLHQTGSRPRALLVAAVDDTCVPPVGAIAALCWLLGADGSHVVAVDATSRRLLGRHLGFRKVGRRMIDLGGATPLELIVLGEPWGDRDVGALEQDRRLSGADAVLVLATIDLGVGAAHLRAWASRAVVTLRAGRASAQRVDAVGRTLEAAGITVSSAILLDADEDDETSGVLEERLPAPAHVAGEPLFEASATTS